MKKIRQFIQDHPNLHSSLSFLLTSHYVLTGHPVNLVFRGMIERATDDEIRSNLHLSQEKYDRICQLMNAIVNHRIWLEKNGLAPLSLGVAYVVDGLVDWSKCEYNGSAIDPMTRHRRTIEPF